ncbi:hypothetical protein [Arcobacter sp. LA11]|uniref:hypothetical protein n=1 Tax=Arcobacter sp. LA11 TaxID=1898176 RepID=UPI0009333509|nr:hypothetical protein [Arcobacter sp. LA11]
MRVNIKKIIALLSIYAVGTLSLSASTVYLTEDLKLSEADVQSGIVLEKKDAVSSLKGFRKVDSTEIYATKNLSLKIADVKDSKIVKVSKKGDIEEVVLSLNIKEDKLSEDYYDAWEEREEIFLEKCSQCHASPEIGSHTMLEWEGLYLSMKGFAQPTPEEEIAILRYLKTFAKDGIIKEEE